MRHTVLAMLAMLVSAGALVYALLVVAGDVHHVSDELDTVAHDLDGIATDVRSLADDVNAIADALAGDEQGDDTRQAPAASRCVPRRPTRVAHARARAQPFGAERLSAHRRARMQQAATRVDR